MAFHVTLSKPTGLALNAWMAPLQPPPDPGRVQVMEGWITGFANKTLTYMKNYIVILGLIVTHTGHAQEKFTTYDNTYEGKSYNIQIHGAPDKFTLYIDAMAMDRIHDDGGFYIDMKNYQTFINSLAEAKEKYNEWVTTAKQNNVKEVSKEMTIKSKAGGFFLYGSDWQFQFLIKPEFGFRVFEKDNEVKYLLIVRTGDMQSSSNQYMEVDGFALVFTSPDEITSFLDSISMQKIRAYFTKPKAADLFTN
jgi:hypothetical protein